MMNCNTCRYWRKIREEDFSEGDILWRGPHGECLLLDEDSTDKAAWLAADDEDLSLITRPEFGCNQWQPDDNKASKNGDIFLKRCREVIDECSRLPERAPRVAVFALCVMLDSSGEGIGPEYVLSVRNEDGILEPVKFNHHDL